MATLEAFHRKILKMDGLTRFEYYRRDHIHDHLVPYLVEPSHSYCRSLGHGLENDHANDRHIVSPEETALDSRGHSLAGGHRRTQTWCALGF